MKRKERGSRKSEHPITPWKQGNRTHRNLVEGRGCRIMEPLEGKMSETSSSESISTKLRRVAELARKAPGMMFTTLAHLIDVDFLHEAYRRTRKNAAAGIDGKTAEEYGKDLEKNLESLLNRFKSGRYRAPAVKRAYIPKGDGKRTRPIGVPTFEDKVLQRAVVMVLEAVYEQDFYDCSYGFRPRRSAHRALDSLWEKLGIGGGWVLEVDIQNFFDSLDHEHLRRFLDRRVCDGVIRRVIGKWLRAGVLEDGKIIHPEHGTPQGGVVSPVLANVFLHEVLDRWFEEVVKPRMVGSSYLFRYVDDAVMVFASEYDARRVLEVLSKRFMRFGLKLHSEKTRLIRFNHPGSIKTYGRSKPKVRPATFDFLGFTHYWGKSRKGRWTVKRKTASPRFSKALRAIAQWCRQNRHMKVSEQHKKLVLKVRGHYQYYGITPNGKALKLFDNEVRCIWRKWLNRRSDRAGMDWEKFIKLLQRYPLPAPRVVHSAFRRVASP